MERRLTLLISLLSTCFKHGLGVCIFGSVCFCIFWNMPGIGALGLQYSIKNMGPNLELSLNPCLVTHQLGDFGQFTEFILSSFLIRKMGLIPPLS